MALISFQSHSLSGNPLGSLWPLITKVEDLSLIHKRQLAKHSIFSIGSVMKKLILTFYLLSLPMALFGHSEFTSSDGSKSMWATPLTVVGSNVTLQTKAGKTLKAKLDSFSEIDQTKLKAWGAAMENRPQAALNTRVKKARSLQVLFIGNSYSYFIPKIFESIAEREGKRVKVDQVTRAAWRLENHAAAEETLQKIANGNWDVVVLQEQSVLPTFPEQERSSSMYPAVNKLAATAKSIGAIPVLFQTWGRKGGERTQGEPYPAPSYLLMQESLREGYARAAEQAGGIYVVPVGEVWESVRKTGLDDGLYSEDGSHPLNSGNFLGSCVFYSALFGEKVTKPESRIENAQLIAKLAESAILQPLEYPLE